MLNIDSLLTFLLPYRASEAEVDFHANLVLTAYREFYDQFEATGYRNRELLLNLKKRTRYSMHVLFWQRPSFWLHIITFRSHAWNMKKAVTPLDKTAEVLEMP